MITENIIKKIVDNLKKSNEHAQEARAETVTIKKLLNKMQFEVEIILVCGHEKEIGMHRQQPLKHLIRECNQSARKTREEINKRDNETNIKFYSYYSIQRKVVL